MMVNLDITLSFWMQLILVCRYLTLVCRYLTVQALGPLIGWRTKDLDEEDLHLHNAFMLTLPGKVLDISALNSQHKFRDRGKKHEH